jgi:hypothetical protein
MRDALVAEVDATPPVRRRRPSRGTVAAVVTAFLVGGGLTGGLTAAALPGADPDAVLQAELAAYSKSMVEDANYGTVLGTPSATAGRDRSALRLGARPAGADRVAVAWACTTPGTVTVRVGATTIDGVDACAPGDAGSVPGGGTHFALQGIRTDGRDAMTIDVSGSDGAHYVVWATYARGAEVAEPSPQQDAETADGRITLAEYTTAFNRLLACQAQAGQPMGNVPLTWYADGMWVPTARPGSTGPWYLYSTPSEGSEVFDTQCYPREFSDVDALWQAEHPQPEDPPAQP